MWPEGKTSAFTASFDFDAEELWIGEDPENSGRPGVLSQGTYGVKVGLDLVLGALSEHGVRATFFVPGRVCQLHPDQVRKIIAEGHEIGHHGFTHTSPTKLSIEAEERELVNGLTVLTGLGAEVVGYRSPSWDFSPHTLSLLSRHGFLYSSNLMDDIAPYRHPQSSLVELPVHWILDDAPHFWFDGSSWTKTIQSPAAVKDLWLTEMMGIQRLGGVATLTMHPQIIGRPSRISLLDDVLSWAVAQPNLWIATAREVAESVA